MQQILPHMYVPCTLNTPFTVNENTPCMCVIFVLMLIFTLFSLSNDVDGRTCVRQL